MSAAPKFTPGPWVWNKDRDNLACPTVGHDAYIIRSADYEGMWFARYEKKEAAANLRLIAAAPELYEALRDAVEMLDASKCPLTVAAGRAALAKVDAS